MQVGIQTLRDTARERRVAAGQLREQADGLLKQVQRLSNMARDREAEATELDASADALHGTVVGVVEQMMPREGRCRS